MIACPNLLRMKPSASLHRVAGLLMLHLLDHGGHVVVVLRSLKKASAYQKKLVYATLVDCI